MSTITVNTVFTDDWVRRDFCIPFDHKERNQLLNSLLAVFYDLRLNNPEYARNKAVLQMRVLQIREWNARVAERKGQLRKLHAA